MLFRSKEAFVEAVEAALALRDTAKAEALIAEIDALDPVQRTPVYQAQAARLRSRLRAQRGEEGVEQGFKLAAAIFRELPMPYWIGVTLAEHGEWLAAQGQGEEAEPLLAEAREIFERLGARPWLERLEAAAPEPARA